MKNVHSASRKQAGRLRSGRRGNAMVEFALTFGLFMVFFIATVEGGRLMWSWASLAHATREGARYAMVHGESNPLTGDELTIEEQVKFNAIGLDDDDISVTTSWADVDKTRGTQVAVDSTYAFRFIVSGVTGSQTITLRSQSTVPVAY